MGSFWRSMRTFENGDRLDILVTLVENTGNSVAHAESGQCRPTLQDTRSSFSSQAVTAPESRRSSIVHADLKIARSIYRTRVEEYPGRLIMICDHARVLARSDQPEPR